MSAAASPPTSAAASGVASRAPASRRRAVARGVVVPRRPPGPVRSGRRRAIVSASADDESLPPTDWPKEWRSTFGADDEEAVKTFFLDACADLAGVETRFIVISDAILETVQPFPASAAFATLGAKGVCCTLASDDKSFEAHVFLNRVRAIALARSERGGRKIYAVRVFGEPAEDADDPAAPPPRPMLTALLHGDPDPDAVAKWEALAEKLP